MSLPPPTLIPRPVPGRYVYSAWTGQPPPLVAVLGRKRAGKDTLAARLIEAHGFERIAFADALRGAALALDPTIVVEADELGIAWPDGRYWDVHHRQTRLSALVDELGWERAKELREVRRTLQRFGVGVRALQPDFWVDVVRERLERRTRPVVVTDCRFPNELSTLRQLGARTVRLVRTDAAPTGDEHESETALDSYVPDLTIAAATGQTGFIADEADELVRTL